MSADERIYRDALRERFLGKRVRCTSMEDDPAPIAPGETGTIDFVDDMGVIHVSWDSGRRLGLIPELDHFELLND